MWLSTLPHQFPHCCLHLSKTGAPRPTPPRDRRTDPGVKSRARRKPLPPSRPHSHLGPLAARPGLRKRGTGDATRRRDSRPGRGSLEGAARGARRQRDGVPGARYSPRAGPAPHSQSHSSARNATGRREGIFVAAARADPHGERVPTRSPALACATLPPRLAKSPSSRCAGPALRAARPPPEVWLKVSGCAARLGGSRVLPPRPPPTARLRPRRRRRRRRAPRGFPQKEAPAGCSRRDLREQHSAAGTPDPPR